MSGELKVHFVEGGEVLNIKKWVNFSVLLKEQIIIKALYYQGACANRRSALMMEKMLEEKRRDELARQERKISVLIVLMINVVISNIAISSVDFVIGYTIYCILNCFSVHMGG
ncbi:hypothetical protein [Bartonella sp. ML70XJBT]|uniref:hypothetical protein n=1 Tax=Bartonella sp. ML70XJBT TaxID=3019096 RepID=UPI002362C924|nr:hypothetical protein [Bartonella sp. ML70XJBT]